MLSFGEGGDDDAPGQPGEEQRGVAHPGAAGAVQAAAPPRPQAAAG